MLLCYTGIIDYSLIRPYLLPSRLAGDVYEVFLDEMLPELLLRKWFQRDGSPGTFFLSCAAISGQCFSQTVGYNVMAQCHSLRGLLCTSIREAT